VFLILRLACVDLFSFSAHLIFLHQAFQAEAANPLAWSALYTAEQKNIMAQRS